MRTPPTSLYMAFYVTSSAKLYVRIGTRDAYVANDYWSQFGEIIEMNIPSRAIIFEELLTEDLCVMAWDTDNDGYLSAPEAAAVTDLGTVFYEQPITSFKELSFFIGLTSITSGAFYNCGNLSSVNIPNKVTSIGDNAFWGCTMLKSITIPNGVTSIEQYAFYDCRSLTSVTLPNSVTSIGNAAFCECTSLTSISIPNSVTSIGEFAFSKCRKLESVNIPLGVPIISKYAFYDCGSLTSLTIPNSVTIIDDGAFMYCNNLTSISIPNCVTSIGDWAFFDCMGLASVIIGSSVETIGKGAFPDVDKYKLSDIYCLGKTAPSAVDAFSGTLSKIKLHIPMDGAYYNQEPWRSMTQDYRQICATPTYSLVGSTLKFECETPGVTYHYNYTVEGENADHLDTGGKCTVTFYAKKEGYTDSLPVTAVVDMPATLKGDVNQDGQVTITDAVNVVDIILGGE